MVESERDHSKNVALSQLIQVIPTGSIVDAMNGRGAMHINIKPCSPHRLPSKIFGPALTCDCGSSEVLGLRAALEEKPDAEVENGLTCPRWLQSLLESDQTLRVKP